jgi:hypothetical protein
MIYIYTMRHFTIVCCLLLILSLVNGNSINDNCLYLSNGWWCIDNNMIECENNTLITTSACSTTRTDGCLDIKNCKCINNWSGFMCSICEPDKECVENNNNTNIIEWWVWLLISIIIVLLCVIICSSIYLCKAFSGFMSH